MSALNTISCGSPVPLSAPLWQFDLCNGAPGVLLYTNSAAAAADGPHHAGAAGL